MYVHFVGIGGIGMSGIARVLVEMGYRVSGSDLKETGITQKLVENGIQFFIGHSARHISNPDIVVVSSAVPGDNSEVQEARRRNIPILQRAEMLGYLMRKRIGIAIAGTHGKTTTTSMVASILERVGKDPTLVVGGELNGSGRNARLGAGQFLVAEADESDASFLKLHPQIAVVTNIDADVNLSASAFAVLDFDYAKTLKRVEELFLEFLQRIPKEGHAVVCADCPILRKMVEKLSCNRLTYGIQAGAELMADEIKLHGINSAFAVRLRGKPLGLATLQVPGVHNVLNALGAMGAALQLGVSFEEAREALAAFQGVQRRFQILGEAGSIMVVDDYAHNPTKIKAALAAARAGWNRRTVVVFQPHRYTRTKFLYNEFVEAFGEADVLLVTEIYSAGELPISGVSGEALARQIKEAHPEKTVYFCAQSSAVIERLLEVARLGDMVLTVGAGDVYLIGYQFLDLLKSKN